MKFFAVNFKDEVVYIDEIDPRGSLLKSNETSEVSATFYHHRKFRKFLNKKFHVQDIIRWKTPRITDLIKLRQIIYLLIQNQLVFLKIVTPVFAFDCTCHLPYFSSCEWETASIISLR